MKGKYGVVIDNASNCMFDSLAIESYKGEPVQITNGTGLIFNNAVFTSESETMLNLKGTNSHIVFKNVNSDSFRTNFVTERKEGAEVIFK